MRNRSLLALFVLAASVPAAAAQSPREALRSACSADAKSFCANVTPGGGRILRCLQDNRDKLSEACRAALAAAKQAK
ncbi:cysteine rich repeat-containing protein [Blastochloris sulfoviridis]|uniref:Cysteine rich repeat protein n=1 Tax=Blastochloris sulfoviridis TaxID=50712 RepID=A0A5M6I162_9HYPH|nr:cysteine rich repeat-containing protein [Blastochloris sulfoviridis]KAA5601902.1 hypothetical protein F1193_08215 [Blastochloris sulfoviridis]